MTLRKRELDLFLKETEVDRKYENLIKELFNKAQADIEVSKETHGSFIIRSWMEASNSKELRICGLLWKEIIEIFNRYKNFVKIDLMVIGEFSVDIESKTDDRQEDLLSNFKNDPYLVRNIGLPLGINDNSKFHLSWDDDLYYKRAQLQAMGYLKKDEIWIPCSRIIQIKFTLD